MIVIFFLSLYFRSDQRLNDMIAIFFLSIYLKIWSKTECYYHHIFLINLPLDLIKDQMLSSSYFIFLLQEWLVWVMGNRPKEVYTLSYFTCSKVPVNCVQSKKQSFKKLQIWKIYLQCYLSNCFLQLYSGKWGRPFSCSAESAFGEKGKSFCHFHCQIISCAGFRDD